MKHVRSLDDSSRGTCQNPELASAVEKNWAVGGTASIACLGVTIGYDGRRVHSFNFLLVLPIRV